MTHRFCIELAADAVVVDSHDFTRLDVADIFGTHHVECTSLAGYDIAVTDLAKGKRVEAILVTTCIDTTSCHHHEGKGTIDHIQCILQ